MLARKTPICSASSTSSDCAVDRHAPTAIPQHRHVSARKSHCSKGEAKPARSTSQPQGQHTDSRSIVMGRRRFLNVRPSEHRMPSVAVHIGANQSDFRHSAARHHRRRRRKSASPAASPQKTPPCRCLGLRGEQNISYSKCPRAISRRFPVPQHQVTKARMRTGLDLKTTTGGNRQPYLPAKMVPASLVIVGQPTVDSSASIHPSPASAAVLEISVELNDCTINSMLSEMLASESASTVPVRARVFGLWPASKGGRNEHALHGLGLLST